MAQAVHGGNPSVPASTTSGSYAPSGIPTHKRYSSRSNSFSSASIVTVKRAGSLSSTSTGARNSIAQMRAQSPGETSLITMRIGRDQLSQSDKRRKSVAIDSTERSDSDGLGKAHRQSNSASSSATSGSYAKRHRASSGAMLPGLNIRGLSPQKRSAGTIDYSPRSSLHQQQYSNSSSRIRYSPAASPERERRRPARPELTNPLNALPPLHATPALTDPNDTESPSTIQTITTPSTQTSYGPDYFHDDSVSPEKNVLLQKPIMIRKQSDAIQVVDHQHLQATAGAQQSETMEETSPMKDATAREVVERRQDPQRASTSEPSTSSRSKHHKSSRTREKGEKDKKVMLSKALEKANTAVLLDNAQNFEGALAAYSDACNLLQQVMDRSTGSDDKRKLEAIKSTYTTRIEELHQLGLAGPASSDEKDLPPRPMSDDSLRVTPALASPSLDASMSDKAAVGRATSADVATLPYRESDADTTAEAAVPVEDSAPRISDPPKDASLFQLDLEDISLTSIAIEAATAIPREPEMTPATHWKPATDEVMIQEASPSKTRSILLPPPQLGKFVPAPLSPKRPPPSPPKTDVEPVFPDEPDFSSSDFLESSFSRDPTALGPSWLDTIDETTSSCGSSVHSVSSETGLRRKYLRGVSGVSNPDFDAAFDAAVEAAYDEGLEPDMDGADKLGKMRAKHGPNESIVVRSSEIAEIPSPESKHRVLGTYNWDSEDEEEERMLDDIAQDYANSFNFDVSSKSALPRISDSSTLSRSTWQSSQTSDRATAGTSLSTVAEDAPPTSSKNAFAASGSINTLLSEPLPPLSGAPPQTSLPRPPSMSQSKIPGVRSRRVSSQNIKPLKIETASATEPRQRASTFHHSSSPFKESAEQVQQPEFDKDFKFGTPLELSTVTESPSVQELHSPPSLDLRSAVSDTSRPQTATTTTESQRSLDNESDQFRSLKPTLIKKDNKSATSLREHMVLLGSPTIDQGPSLLTPLSSTFMNFQSKRNNETPLTSQRAKLPAFTTVTGSGDYAGQYALFDTSLTAPQSASSPLKSPGVPVGVEPCPESFLLRPFWLMRNIASTLTHGKGGFLTSRLFVPKEVWQTKGVKLKCLEDKIANCDLLTAALGRLTLVDTYDADAVMEELESFEDVMERVQNALVKKLGSDVGTGGLSSMFKDASAGAVQSSNGSLLPDTVSVSDKMSRKEGKGYFNNFLKLRSKSSGAPGAAAQFHTKGSEKEALNMSTVPMTSYVPVERRGQKKDARTLTFDGPNKEYMSSLAKLFEGVQVLDQIARQVEDPGLKGTSQTHVGLELSIRHAAEFFGFHICRFVLTDVGVLLDKYLKRSTEEVTS